MSQELSKRVTAGNYRHLALKHIVQDPEHLGASQVSRRNATNELSQMLKDCSWVRKDHSSYQATAGGQDLTSEHQALLSSDEKSQLQSNIRVIYNQV